MLSTSRISSSGVSETRSSKSFRVSTSRATTASTPSRFTRATSLNGTPAGGRFIIGAGVHNNKWFPLGSDQSVDLKRYIAYDEDTDQETATSRSTGGEEEHTLTIEEMPSHTHQFEYVSVEERNRERSGGPDPIWKDAKKTENTLAVGGRQPHNNMPPHIALYFCK